MIHDILVAIPFGVILSFTIGPVFFLLIETSITKGLKSALFFNVGVFSADIIFILAAFFSTNGIRDSIKNNPNFLIFGGVLLTIYGIVLLRNTLKSYKSVVNDFYNINVERNFRKIFAKGFMLNFINIGVLLGWLSFIVIAESITISRYGSIIFIAAIIATSFIVDLFKIIISERLKNKLTPKIIFKSKRVIAFIILGFGLFLLVKSICSQMNFVFF